MSVAEFQKLHTELAALRKAGKHEETMKFCTSDCYFMTPLRDPYDVKEAVEIAKSPKMEEYSKAETTVHVDDVKVYGDIACDRGRFVLKHKDGDKKGSYLIVWKKDGSGWKVMQCCVNFQIQ